MCEFWFFPNFQALGASIIEIWIVFSEPLSKMAIKHNHANGIATISLHSYAVFSNYVDDEVHKLLSGSGLMKLASASLILTIWWVNYNAIPVFVFIKCNVIKRITDVSIMTHLKVWLKYAWSDVFVDLLRFDPWINKDHRVVIWSFRCTIVLISCMSCLKHYVLFFYSIHNYI